MAASATSDKKGAHSIRGGRELTGDGSCDSTQPGKTQVGCADKAAVTGAGSNESTQPEPGKTQVRSADKAAVTGWRNDRTQPDPGKTFTNLYVRQFRLLVRQVGLGPTIVVCSVWVVCAPLFFRSLMHRFTGQQIFVFMLCSYIFWFLVVFCRASWFTVFNHLSYGFLVAHLAAVQIGPRAGTFTMHLNTAWAAGYLGYALAAHRLRIGIERAIDALPNPAFQSEDEARRFTYFPASLAAIWSVLWLAVMAIVTYLTKPEGLYVVFALSILGWIYLFIWALFLSKGLLRGVLIPEQVLWDMLGYLILCVFASPAIALVNEILFLLFHWQLMLCLAGFVGYNLKVYIHYLHTVPWILYDSDCKAEGVDRTADVLSGAARACLDRTTSDEEVDQTADVVFGAPEDNHEADDGTTSAVEEEDDREADDGTTFAEEEDADREDVDGTTLCKQHQQ